MSHSLRYATRFTDKKKEYLKAVLDGKGWEFDVNVNGIPCYAVGHGHAIADWKKIWSEKPFPEDFPYIPLIVDPRSDCTRQIGSEIRKTAKRLAESRRKTMHGRAYDTLTEAHETGPEFYETFLKYKRLTKEAQV
jgi:hypothetical protein